MKTRVHSFSTKSEADAKLIEQLKIKASRRGQSFSFVVIQALKQMEEAKSHESKA